MIEVALIAAAMPHQIRIFEMRTQEFKTPVSTNMLYPKIEEFWITECHAIQRDREIISKYQKDKNFINLHKIDDLMTELGFNLTSARKELSTLHKQKDIRALRLSLGLTQQQLALNSQVKQPEISALEKGLKKGMHTKKLERIREALNVDRDTFANALKTSQGEGA